MSLASSRLEKVITSPGIVLRRLKHGEDDLHLVLLTETAGKIRVLVKGGRRMQFKLKALLEPFVWADYQIFLPPHRVFGRLLGGRLIQSQSRLSQQVRAFEYACKIVEIVDALLPARAPAPEIFDLLTEALPRMAHTSHPRLEWLRFGVAYLKILGHGDLSDKIRPLSVDRSLAVLQNEFERHLPRRLKSDLFHLPS